MATSIHEKYSGLVPQEKVTHDHLKSLNKMEERFNSRLVGQPGAVAQVTRLVQQIAGGFFDENGPLGVLLFAGSTGVGKTETAKMMADELGCPFFRFDMSEFQHGHKVSRFLGSRTGSIHPPSEGELVKAIKTSPYSVILLHEIEKAHRDINAVFCQLFDEGSLTDAFGTVVSAKHSLFVMTTNLCSRVIHHQSSQELICSKVNAFLILRFSSGFVGRLHNIVIFYPLERDSILSIAQKYFVHLISVIENRKQIKIIWDDNVIPLLVNDDSGFTMGARAVHAKVRERFLKVLTDNYLNGFLKSGDSIRLIEKSEGEIGITHYGKGTEPLSTIELISDESESAQSLQSCFKSNPLSFSKSKL